MTSMSQLITFDNDEGTNIARPGVYKGKAARVQLGMHDKGTNRELRKLKQSCDKPNYTRL